MCNRHDKYRNLTGAANCKEHEMIPKVAKIYREDEFTTWLAGVIQEKIAKENAGFVQVEKKPRDSRGTNTPPAVVVTNDAYSFTVNISTARK